MYKIVEENGRTGSAETLRAEINLGLKKGYGGFLQEKEEVINFLKEGYRQAIAEGRNYIPLCIQQTEIVYAYATDNGPIADAEPALSLFSDRNPLYSADSEKEWKSQVETLACQLAERFQQFRIYVTYIPVEIRIFQQY